jgi:hypothetical protein
MSGILGSGSSIASAPPAPPTVPSKEDAQARMQQEYSNMIAKRKAGGQESTILTGSQGDTSNPNLEKKKLLGS